MNVDIDEFKVQGTKVNYYCICKRKLWFFSKGITMEDKNDRVIQGKIIHESSYKSVETKEVLIDDILKIDILEDEHIREIKTSSKMPVADRMQILYYLYYLKSIGVKKTGIINYVKEKKREFINLDDNSEKEIIEVLKEIKEIISYEKPPRIQNVSYCKKCSYYELCYSGEGD